MAEPSLQGGFDLPFAEQVDFFRKKLNLPTAAWDDIWQSAHDRSFVVAGAMKADLLDDLRQAVDKAISSGTTLETFRKDFRQIVAKNGWTGWTGEGSEGGFNWRTRVIYETNLRSSYAAGRFAQLSDPRLKVLMPFWRYVHNDSVLSPRPLHKQWGSMRLTLPQEHPFWKTHFPPNGWGCRCRVTAVRAPKKGDATEPPDGWDDLDERTGAPRGIDKGWAYAPGASLREELGAVVKAKKKALPKPIADDFSRDVAKVIEKGAFVTAKTVKQAAEFAVKGNLADFADYKGVDVEVANAWNRSLYDHIAKFPELRKNQRFTGTCQAQFKRFREFEIEKVIKKAMGNNPNLGNEAQYRAFAEKYVKVMKVPGHTVAHSWAQPEVSGVAVNQKHGANAAKMVASLKRNVESKFHPPGCDTIRSVVDHELGHQLDDLLGLHIDAEVVSAYKEAKGKGIENVVSKYAGHSIKEFIAECWAEYCNAVSPREFAQKIGGILHQRYADKFGGL